MDFIYGWSLLAGIDWSQQFPLFLTYDGALARFSCAASDFSFKERPASQNVKCAHFMSVKNEVVARGEQDTMELKCDLAFKNLWLTQMSFSKVAWKVRDPKSSSPRNLYQAYQHENH